MEKFFKLTTISDKTTCLSFDKKLAMAVSA